MKNRSIIEGIEFRVNFRLARALVQEAYLISTYEPEQNSKYENIKQAQNLEREQKRASQSC